MDYGVVDIAGRIRVKLLTNAAAEAAYTPPDGSIAYRVDLAQARLRAAGTWVPFSSLPDGYVRGARVSWASVNTVSIAAAVLKSSDNTFDIVSTGILLANITA
jgi:hypothetical protein